MTDTWQWQLQGTINTSYNVNVYDIDLFDVPQNTIDLLKSQGRRVVCYFSAGTSENWRPDFSRFTGQDQGGGVLRSDAGGEVWVGERWLDTRSSNVREIMKARLDLAKSKGCDGVEPDNMDAYNNNTGGLPLTAETQFDYNRFLALEAHARGLAIALKNDIDQLAALEPYFDFAVNEGCHQWNECAAYSVFTNNGKPVFNAEYKPEWVGNATERARICGASLALNIKTIFLSYDLDDSIRWSCN